MRVIAGKYRSRILQSLKGAEIRPTSDRLRETLFDILTAGNPAALTGTVWLDLFAGTGAVGIEALSRGAKMVHFVEESKPATELIRKNLQSLKIELGFNVLQQDAIRGFGSLAKQGVDADFAFLDPPYALTELYGKTLEALAGLRVMKPEGVVIAEHEKRFDPGENPGKFVRYRKLVQGDAVLSFYRRGTA
ncbi:MAG TPA: 16S rRNA (guanine(966)-N(2))-methyltransferase RsmD [Terriglobales bacterium]|nr:16S rRNA (guanine(966)-N(2))-methyltransferase RsmD [Terriglobales bacterium]